MLRPSRSARARKAAVCSSVKRSVMAIRSWYHCDTRRRARERTIWRRGSCRVVQAKYYTDRNDTCTVGLVERLNITLDTEQGAKLARLADRMHMQPGTLARS